MVLPHFLSGAWVHLGYCWCQVNMPQSLDCGDSSGTVAPSDVLPTPTRLLATEGSHQPTKLVLKHCQLSSCPNEADDAAFCSLSQPSCHKDKPDNPFVTLYRNSLMAFSQTRKQHACIYKGISYANYCYSLITAWFLFHGRIYHNYTSFGTAARYGINSCESFLLDRIGYWSYCVQFTDLIKNRIQAKNAVQSYSTNKKLIFWQATLNKNIPLILLQELNDIPWGLWRRKLTSNAMPPYTDKADESQQFSWLCSAESHDNPNTMHNNFRWTYQWDGISTSVCQLFDSV